MSPDPARCWCLHMHYDQDYFKSDGYGPDKLWVTFKFYLPQDYH